MKSVIMGVGAAALAMVAFAPVASAAPADAVIASLQSAPIDTFTTGPAVTADGLVPAMWRHQDGIEGDVVGAIVAVAARAFDMIDDDAERTHTMQRNEIAHDSLSPFAASQWRTPRERWRL